MDIIRRLLYFFIYVKIRGFAENVFLLKQNISCMIVLLKNQTKL